MIYFQALYIALYIVLCISLTPSIFLILYKLRLSVLKRRKDFEIFLENRCGCHNCNKDDEFKLSYLCNKIKKCEYMVIKNDKEKKDFIIYIKNKNKHLTFLETISMYEMLLDYKYIRLCKKYDLKKKAITPEISYNIINKEKDREEYRNNKLLKNEIINKLFRKI
jgi:hypothetical protein